MMTVELYYYLYSLSFYSQNSSDHHDCITLVVNYDKTLQSLPFHYDLEFLLSDSIYCSVVVIIIINFAT